MPFPVQCGCGQRFMAQDWLVGKVVSCPACGSPLSIRRPGAAPDQDPLGAPLLPVYRPQAVEAGSHGADFSPQLKWGMGIAGGVVALVVLAILVQAIIPGSAPKVTEVVPEPEEIDQPRAPAEPGAATPSRQTTERDRRGTDVPRQPKREPSPPEESPPKPPPPPPEDLPQGLIRWFEDPTGRHAGLRRVGSAGSPHSHYSWMCDLLPYLGHQELYDAFEFKKPWTDKQNLQQATVIVPELQNPADDRKRYDGYPFGGLALTHFVGMSGVEDGRNVVAASLPRSDPRAGVFGYDEVAATEDITDGASNTIMIIGSGELASPWAVGGGGTVRGARGGGDTVRGARQPYFDRLSGFGSRGRKSEGALTVMADGSVRFVSPDVDPSVFRAMCTIHGGETVDVSRWTEATNLGR